MTDAVFDPYATLGLRRGADARQVREAYRRLAREYHPDRSRDGRATERMQAINRAREVLSDPVERTRYAETTSARPYATPHWSTRRPARQSWAPPPASWGAGAAAVPPYRSTVPPYRSPMPAADAGPWWPGVVVGALLLVIVGPILLLILPLPFAALFIALAVGAFGRGAGR